MSDEVIVLMHYTSIIKTNKMCRFEGLTREGIPHGKGVLVMGNGTGGGFNQTSRGDRYVLSCALQFGLLTKIATTMLSSLCTGMQI